MSIKENTCFTENSQHPLIIQNDPENIKQKCLELNYKYLQAYLIQLSSGLDATIGVDQLLNDLLHCRNSQKISANNLLPLILEILTVTASNISKEVKHEIFNKYILEFTSTNVVDIEIYLIVINKLIIFINDVPLEKCKDIASTFLFATSKSIQWKTLQFLKSCCTKIDNSQELMEHIWILIVKCRDSNQLQCITVHCFLINVFVKNREMKTTLENDWKYLQIQFLENEDCFRKFILHILKTLYTEKTFAESWDSFFTIVDTMYEKQNNLILPIFSILPKTNALMGIHNWNLILISYILQISTNISVLEKCIEYILNSKYNLETFENEYAFKSLLFNFFGALNNTILYQSTKSNLISKRLTNFIRPIFQHCKEIINKICWKSVPLYYIVEAIDSLTLHTEEEFILSLYQQTKELANVYIRNAIFVKLCKITAKSFQIAEIDSFIQFYEPFFDNAACLDIYNFAQYYIDSVEIIMNKIAENNPSQITKCTVKVALCTKLRDTILNFIQRYFNDHFEDQDTIELKLKQLTEQLPFSLNNEVGYSKNSILSTLDDYRQQTSLAQMHHQIFLNTFILNFISKNEEIIQFKHIEKLLEYHLELALDIIKFNHEKIPHNHFEEMLNHCYAELINCNDSKVLLSFLQLLEIDKASHVKLEYFGKIIKEAERKNKWIYIFIKYICHKENYENLLLVVQEYPDFFIAALSYGRNYNGDKSIEFECCERIFGDNLSDECNDGVSIRCTLLLNVLKLNPSIQFTDIVRQLLQLSQQLNRNKPRYYCNSEQHRLKLRLTQAIAALTSCSKQWYEEFAEILLNENNQLNVTYIMECIIATTISEERLEKLIQQAKTPTVRQSIFMILFHMCYLKRDDSYAEKCIKRILPFAMGKEFNTRVLAQIVIQKLMKEFDVKLFEFYNCIEETLNQPEIDCEKFVNDFRFKLFQNSRSLKPFVYLHVIPQQTLMASNEIAPKRYFSTAVNFLLPLDAMSKIALKQQIKERTEETEYIELDDVPQVLGKCVQKKIVPFKQLFPDMDLIDNLEGQLKEQKKKIKEPGLIVVASLISRATNLGGLSRTCEIFGVEQLILDSLNHINHHDFKALSMTSEKWLNIGEVKPYHLADYLRTMRKKGYCIVGGEQTANGVQINDFKFPKKTVLLLGHEKDGVPADLLNWLDCAVEIPQFGVVRSLNVHVTGALFIWEYSKQHCI